MRFFAAVSQMFGGSSQLTTTAEHCFVVWTVQNDLITVHSAVVGSWEEPLNVWLMVTKNAFVGRASNFRVHILLIGAVMILNLNPYRWSLSSDLHGMKSYEVLSRGVVASLVEGSSESLSDAFM